MPGPDLALLRETIYEAGEIARLYSGPTAKSWDKPDGSGPVTEADLAVNDHLESRLRSARPAYGWLSEETEDDDARLNHETLFIVDPIDGTRSFIEGSGTWAISLAIATAGQVTAAAVYLPMRDKLYSAAVGTGATLNDTVIRTGARSDLDGATLMGAKPIFAPEYWETMPNIKRAYRPSLAYRLSLVAEGRFDAMLTLRPSWEWDIAAGALILSEAGATVSDRTGRALVFNNPVPKVNGVMAANAKLHADIVNRLR